MNKLKMTVVILPLIFIASVVATMYVGDNKSAKDDTSVIKDETSVVDENSDVNIPFEDYVIPANAVLGAYLDAYAKTRLFSSAPSVKILYELDRNMSYFTPDEVDGYLLWTCPNLSSTERIDWVRIGGYNFGADYYNILSDNKTVSGIITNCLPANSQNITESDIEIAAIIEYVKAGSYENETAPGTWPSAVFWVHTTKGDYLLKDAYGYDDNRNIIHNWEVYTLNEYRWN